jgi:hypothetical protein
LIKTRLRIIVFFNQKLLEKKEKEKVYMYIYNWINRKRLNEMFGSNRSLKKKTKEDKLKIVVATKLATLNFK